MAKNYKNRLTETKDSAKISGLEGDHCVRRLP